MKTCRTNRRPVPGDDGFAMQTTDVLVRGQDQDLARSVADQHPKTLTAAERAELARCEEVVVRGWRAFVEVGQALATIRDRRLYREGYRTFEAYCLAKWRCHRAHAYRLIAAQEVVACLSPIGDTTLLNETHIRPLIGLTPDRIREVWAKVTAAAPQGQITAKLVRQMAAPYRPIRLIPFRLAGRASRNHEPMTRCGTLKEAGECLDALESDIRAGTANLADLAFIAKLRQCLRAVASRLHRPRGA
jgi:hypothetical protein